MINFLKEYFTISFEHYYYINLIPHKDIFGLADHFYFYLILFLGFVCFLLLRFFSLHNHQRDLSKKYFLGFVLIVWLVFSLPWFLIQIHWLVRDKQDFYKKGIKEKQQIMISRIIETKYLPKNWHNFYEFLEFGKFQVPLNSRIYLVPAQNTFWVWSKYYLYPELELVYTPDEADYIFSFNVNLPESVAGFENFKEFENKKVILKAIND